MIKCSHLSIKTRPESILWCIEGWNWFFVICFQMAKLDLGIGGMGGGENAHYLFYLRILIQFLPSKMFIANKSGENKYISDCLWSDKHIEIDDILLKRWKIYCCCGTTDWIWNFSCDWLPFLFGASMYSRINFLYDKNTKCL